MPSKQSNCRVTSL